MKMNVKKISIFVDNWLRRRMDDPDGQELAEAFGHAMVFVSLVVQHLTASKGWIENHNLPEMLRAAHKHFCSSYSQSDWLSKAFSNSVRIEAVLKVMAQGVVGVEFFFYKRSAKEAHYELRAQIDSTGKLVGGTGTTIKQVS